MKLECVVTCVGYGDFLAETLPLNRSLFNQLVVVTSPDDKETQRVCEFYHTKCIKTEEFQSHRGHFCKGAGINVGLSHLEKDAWILQMDGDIVLPPLTRVILEKLELDTTHVYGCDRFMVPSYDAWRRFMVMPKLNSENETWTHLDAFPIGVRVSRGHKFTPIGFFQLWHKDSGILEYPAGHTGAARDDMSFAEKWPRHKRSFLPELTVYHLESEPVVMGANWNGRKTASFGPAPLHPIRSITVAETYSK